MKESENNAWFYIRDHQQQGPVGLFELNKLIEQGILSDETFIWTKDMDCWQMAKTLDLFSEIPIHKKESKESITVNYANKCLGTKTIYSNGRPFIRCLARFFDLSLFSFFLIFSVSSIAPKFTVESSGVFVFMLSFILWILTEAVILSIFGNTLGKALLNTKLKTVTGDPIDFQTALKRCIFLNTAGMGLGVPIINFICLYFSYFDLKKNGKSAWDQQIGTVVLYGKVSFSRILFVILFLFAFLIAGIII